MSARWDTAQGVDRAGSVTIHGGEAGWPVLGRLEHPTPGVEDSFGAALAAVDDLDGDGRRDLLVGAYQDDVPGSADAGSAFVFSGSLAAGFALIGAVDNPSPAAGDEFGYSVAALGDVDGDGVGDLVVGARGDDGKGSAFVFSGQTRASLGKLEDPAGSAGDLFGYQVARIDDLDGDGRDDVLVGAYEADAGRVYVFSGATRLPIRTVEDPSGNAGDQFGRGLDSIGDLNGDAWPEILVGASGRNGQGQVVIVSGIDGTVVDRIDDPDGATGDSFGDRVIALDDLDGDGVDEFVAGAYLQDTPEGANHGSARVFHGALEQDPDGDRYGNACDDDDDGDPSWLRWSLIGGATGYDVFRADLAPAGAPPMPSCVDRLGNTIQYFDGEIPAPGTGYGFLVRGRNVCGTGSLGFDSSGDERRPAVECP